MIAVNPHYQSTPRPPVMEARRWLAGKIFSPDRPLINLSQAAPVDPPPKPLRDAMARAITDTPQAHLYGPVLGLPALREEIACQWSDAYGGVVDAAQVAITAGCNQAFTAVISTLAGAGDEIILPLPYYFNHKMWLDMAGMRMVPLSTGQGMIPDPQAAAALITPKTRAIVLVTPNNPSGAEYPAGVVRAFYDLARAHGIALVMDETYRDFHSQPGAPHDLFTDPDWDQTLIHLYSFSKAYRLTGHRVGAILAATKHMIEIEKYLDTVAICAPQIGQIGALWGMRNLKDWLANQRQTILARRAAMTAYMAPLAGWRVLSCGAYFALVTHPFDLPSDQVARNLVEDAALLTLPGTMFGPTRPQGGDGQAETTLRIAFANADEHGLQEMARRLGALSV